MATSAIYKQVGKSSLIYGIGIIAGRFASFLLLPVYTRYLTPRDYGVLELLDLTLTIFAMFLGGRFAEALFYFYSNAPAPEARVRILSTTVAGAWLIGCVGGAIGISASPFVSRLVFQSADFTRYFQITFAGFGLSLPIEVGFSWLRALDRPALFVLAAVARLSLTLCLTILFVVGYGAGILGVLWSNLIVGAIAAVVLTAISVWRAGIALDAGVFMKLIRFAVPLSFGGIALFLIHSGDRFFLQRFATLTDLGIYAIAYKLGMLVSQVQTAFTTYWTAHGYNALRGEDAPEIFARVNTYMAAIVVWSGVVIIAFSPPVLFLMASPPFFPALRYVPWIVLAYVVRAEADYLRFSLYLDARTGADAGLTWTAAIACVAAYALLIPRYKLWGAVAATLIAFLVLTGGAWRLSRRMRAYPLERRRLLHLAIPAAAIAGAIMLLEPSRGWAQWAAALGASAAYPAILYWTGFLRPGEKAALREAITGLRFFHPPVQATKSGGNL